MVFRSPARARSHLRDDERPRSRARVTSRRSRSTVRRSLIHHRRRSPRFAVATERGFDGNIRSSGSVASFLLSSVVGWVVVVRALGTTGGAGLG